MVSRRAANNAGSILTHSHFLQNCIADARLDLLDLLDCGGFVKTPDEEIDVAGRSEMLVIIFSTMTDEQCSWGGGGVIDVPLGFLGGVVLVWNWQKRRYDRTSGSNNVRPIKVSQRRLREQIEILFEFLDGFHGRRGSGRLSALGGQGDDMVLMMSLIVNVPVGNAWDILTLIEDWDCIDERIL